MGWSLAALHVYMPDWPMTLAKIAKAALLKFCARLRKTGVK
jgi:hypothetical protein